jgi:hypothetical protein
VYAIFGVNSPAASSGDGGLSLCLTCAAENLTIVPTRSAEE